MTTEIDHAHRQDLSSTWRRSTLIPVEDYLYRSYDNDQDAELIRITYMDGLDNNRSPQNSVWAYELSGQEEQKQSNNYVSCFHILQISCQVDPPYSFRSFSVILHQICLSLCIANSYQFVLWLCCTKWKLSVRTRRAFILVLFEVFIVHVWLALLPVAFLLPHARLHFEQERFYEPRFSASG